MTNHYNPLDKKTVLITGGTGSFGYTICKHLLSKTTCKIRIISRDEKKQYDMRQSLNSNRLDFIIGDVANNYDLNYYLSGVDIVFHAAALKQVPSCEFFPLEAVRTNILGTANIIDAAIAANCERVVCLSTDKAVYPINSMGLTKSLMEKVVGQKSRYSGKTILSITRYGNVLASRGSVVPHFINQIKNGIPMTITNPDMTRFLMTLDEAVDLVLHSFAYADSGDIYVQKAPSCDIKTLAQAVAIVCSKPEHPTVTIGDRHGEKLYETLISAEEMRRTKDSGRFYHIAPDNRDLNYSHYFDSVSEDTAEYNSYHSHNTQRYDLEKTVKLLSSVDLSEYL